MISKLIPSDTSRTLLAQKHPGFQWSNPNGAENSESFQKQQIQGPLPSNTQKNPKEHLKAIALRLDKNLDETYKDTQEKNQSSQQVDKGKNAETPSEQSEEKEKKMEEENILPVKIPFPQKMKRQKLDSQFAKFLDILKQIHINIPFTDALLQMPSYAKFLKEILSSKRKLEEASVVVLTEKYSAILQNKLPQKLGDPGSFTIPCTLGGVYFEKALCDSGASINLMSFSIFRKFDPGEIKNISVSLQFADQSTKKTKGIIENILVRVDKFVFPVDFIILEMQQCPNEPIILGRPFLATGRTIIDVHQGQLILRVDEERVIFDRQKMLRFSGEETSSLCFSIDVISDLADEFKDDKLILDSMEICLSKSSTSQDDDPSIRSKAEILEKHYKDEEIQSEEVQPKIELKILPSHLKYVYLEHKLFPLISSSSLYAEQEDSLIEVLRAHREP
ncbi:uncharacterized protein LOC132624170 [Lycium barbarum]|uniref:uncharacterized protein LOC132624170 n=1 Tax=Lycium barbarum TaxID=112863 RepID=UPI00293E0842|nr:uncharacterized protein LOC132624170 [Lycium barbarum]